MLYLLVLLAANDPTPKGQLAFMPVIGRENCEGFVQQLADHHAPVHAWCALASEWAVDRDA